MGGNALSGGVEPCLVGVERPLERATLQFAGIAGIEAVSGGSSLRGCGVFFWQSKMYTSLQSKTHTSLAPRLHNKGITMP